MKKIGGYLVFFGLFAIVLGFLNRVPKILIWIYNWGETTAWIIKIALVIVGGALYLLGGSPEEPEQVIETKESEES